MNFASLRTHFEIVGSTRSGKSKDLELICRDFTDTRVPYCLIDRKGQTAKDVNEYHCVAPPRHPVMYLDCGRTDWLIPFNPYLRGDIDKCVDSTMEVWRADGNTTPQLSQWLGCVYYLFSKGEYTFNEVIELLSFSRVDLREKALVHFEDNHILWRLWSELLSYKRQNEYDAQIGSTRRRFMRFTTKKQLRRIMGLPINLIDFDRIIDEGITVIVNLQPTRDFSVENGILIGTLIISEIIDAVMRRARPPRRPYFLLIDEAQDFISNDVRDILDRGAGHGLHLGLIHQHPGQIHDQWVRDSVVSGTRVKKIFGGLPHQWALFLAQEIFMVEEGTPRDLSQRLMHQKMREHWVFDGVRTVQQTTPFVKPYPLFDSTIAKRTLEKFIVPWGLMVEDIDEQLQRRFSALFESQSDKKDLEDEQKFSW